MYECVSIVAVGERVSRSVKGRLRVEWKACNQLHIKMSRVLAPAAFIRGSGHCWAAARFLARFSARFLLRLSPFFVSRCAVLGSLRFTPHLDRLRLGPCGSWGAVPPLCSIAAALELDIAGLREAAALAPPPSAYRALFSRSASPRCCAAASLRRAASSRRLLPSLRTRCTVQ